MKKKLLALLCALALLVSALPAAAAQEGDGLRAADTLAALGLIESAAPKDYRLFAAAKRAQAAALLVAMSGKVEEAQQSTFNAGFRDLPEEEGKQINYAAQQGWITGATAQDFQPEGDLDADVWFGWLLAMLGYSSKDGDFTPAESALFAQRIGLAAKTYSGTLSRGELYESAAGALVFPYKDGAGTPADRLAQDTPSRQAVIRALGLLDESITVRQAADRLTAAVFCLDTYEKPKDLTAKKPSANATGFFISSDGLAVTNYHSIDEAIYGLATLSTGESYEVESVLYYDVDIDIAVLRISKTSTEGKTTSAFKSLELVGTKDACAGDTVYAIGNPLGMGLSVSSGVISATERKAEDYALPCLLNTAAISKGSSGGPLLNIYGKVVAVTTGAFTYGNSMYLAVPVEPVMEADLTGEGQTLAEVAKAVAAQKKDK